MKRISPDKIAAIRRAATRGTPALETARALGIRKDTVLKYQRQMKASDLPHCGCGRLSTHTGQCSVRAAARKATTSFPLVYPKSMHTARLVHGYAGVMA